MIFVLFALMTAVAVLAVLVPLSRARAVRVSSQAHAQSVYRDQLGEIERDLERGLIAQREADAARTEVARRLLAAAASESAATPDPAAATTRRRIAAATALLLVPALGLGVYAYTGSPNLPAQPLAARLEGAPETQEFAIVLRRIELHLAQNPEDGRGWDLVAPVYARMGRIQDALLAYRNALRLVGPSAERHGGVGEALTIAAGGVVTAEAKAAFQAALEADRRDMRARFYLARAAEQDGEPARAVEFLRGILADSPADAPWLGMVRGEIARLAPPAPSEPPAPGAQEVETLARLPAAERDAMIRGMVERLAERLRSNPDDPDGWLRLVRAYAVLGDRARAQGAAEDARRALATRPEAHGALDALLRELGLGG